MVVDLLLCQLKGPLIDFVATLDSHRKQRPLQPTVDQPQAGSVVAETCLLTPLVSS